MTQGSEMIKTECALDSFVPISDLKSNPKNPNSHSKEQIDRIIKILNYQGWRRPIIVSKRSGLIVCGHGRLLAAQKMGLKEVPVDFQDYENEDQEYADMIADNAIASWAELDLSEINKHLAEINGQDFDIEVLGLKDFQIEPADKYADKDADEIPEPKESFVKQGDLWILGNHRLLCGDSTDKAQVERLMNGEKADMAFTSPPYNLGENAKLRGYNGDGDDSAYLTKSDHKTSEEYLEFLNKFTSNALEVSKTLFVNIQLLAGNKFVLPKFWERWHSWLIDMMIWDKEHAAPQLAERVLNSVFEFIFIFSSDQWPTRSMKHGKLFRGDIQNIYRLNPMRGPKDESKKTTGPFFRSLLLNILSVILAMNWSMNHFVDQVPLLSLVRRPTEGALEWK